MKIKKILPLALITFISACNQSPSVLEKRIFPFDSYVNIRLYEGEETDLKNLTDIFNRYDALSDNYLKRNITNVYSINETNDEIQIDEDLYDLLKVAYEVKDNGASNYNIMCGSLSKKWKESLNNGQILDENIVNEELTKIQNSSLLFKDNNIVQRVGEAEIDLGGIVKGYALDRAQEYLKEHDIKRCLIDGGMSSILLGKKNTEDGHFNVDLSEICIDKYYLKIKDCFISTSGIYKQGKTIDGVTYSHIVNPVTGSAVSLNDAVVVISEEGYFGDAMSTSMMMNAVDEIKELEETYNLKTIVVKDGLIIYQNEDIEVNKY